MKQHKKLILTALLTFGIGSAYAAAEIPKFDAADANGDSFVDEAEFAPAKAAGAPKPFAEFDTNKDGKLDKEEYAAVLGEECE